MKFTKSQKSNLAFLILLIVLLFTPIGGIIKEYISKIRAQITSVKVLDDSITVKNYDWNLQGINTEDLNFNQTKGKVVFINFWATWCPPCRAEMPSLQKLYNDYKDKAVFLFITNEESEKVHSFFNKKNYDLSTYNPKSVFPKEFNVSSIPATYVLNKKGEIVIHKVGPADWNSDKMREILDDLLNE